jgi:hypothetical protein
VAPIERGKVPAERGAAPVVERGGQRRRIEEAVPVGREVGGASRKRGRRWQDVVPPAVQRGGTTGSTDRGRQWWADG